ncbi:MAG: M14 family zinc carboxypeptidase, partial [Bdellovibrionales bacterium]
IFIAGKHSPRKKQGQYFLDLYGTAFSTYKARFGVSADGVDAVVATTAKAFDINEYHCFTGTYDGANLKIYADGLLAGNPIPYKSGIFSGAAPFTVGNTKPESSIFVGNIDEVAIGNVALSDAQVAELYRFGIDGTNGASDTRKPYTLYYPKASWNRNTSYEQILAEISALCSANPSWICRTEGLSGSGREIKSITIPPERALMKTVFLDAAIHGNEKPPVFALMGFLHFLSDHPSLFPTTKIVVYPVVNPDGFVLNQRKNDNKATGESADLNRNFPQIPNGKKPNPESAPRQDVAPASQPETQALMQALKNSRPDKYLNFHTPIDAFMIPGGSGGAAPKAVNNYLEAQGFLKFGVQGGGMPGSAVNWALSNGAEAYVLETRDIDDSDYANLEEYNRIIGAIVGYIDTPVPAKRPPSSRH